MDVDPPADDGLRRITRLEEAVVNRIAAGEVIQRPANAVKELLENALDAGSTRIVVTIKEGGLKLISIQDNGTGIRKDDLPILCERYTTSKIQAFEDLSSLTTYGFRGEALASISHVAHLTVTTKTRSATCGYKAAYQDGKLVPLKVGQDVEPKPLAATDGTLLIIEDLFYNVPLRHNALRSSSEEYNRIFEVVSRYAIHNAGVAIVCRKGTGAATADLSTSNAATQLDNIGAVFGESVRRELVKYELDGDDLGVQVQGWVSSASYNAKKQTFLLFINNRLVQCTPLQRAVENYYSTVLPKGGHSFLYLSLLIDPAKVDVNMHPTKAEVSFLDEEAIIEAICAHLVDTLSVANASRSFTIQTAFPGLAAPPPANASQSVAPSSTAAKVAPQKQVRTDTKTQTLESMLGYDATQGGGPSKFRNGDPIDLTLPSDEVDDDEDGEASQSGQAALGKKKVALAPCSLTSVNAMRREVTAAKYDSVHEILRNFTFVGFVGLDKPIAILQHHTRMYLFDYLPICCELFYQLGLRQFGRLPRVKLKPPPSLRELVNIALLRQPDLPADKSSDEIVEIVCSRFLNGRNMLQEYFSLVISEDGLIEAIPLLLPRYTPNLDRLPECAFHFPLLAWVINTELGTVLLRAGVQVNWQDERACFSSFFRELAAFHRPGPFVPPDVVDDTALAAYHVTPEQQHIIQHVVFPAIKQYLEAPKDLLDGLYEVATLEGLYRRFGRC